MKLKFRNLLILVMAAVVLILSLPLLIYVKLTGSEKGKIFFIHTFAKSLNLAGSNDMQVRGVEYLKMDQNFLVVGNHEGMFDITNICASSPIALGFVSKKENKKIPIMSSWMKQFDSIFLDRDDIRGAIKDINQASKNVKEIRSMVILPQGTRTLEFTDFKPGSLKIATKSKCAIVPVALINTASLFENRTSNRRQTSYVVYHKPITYDEYKDLTIVDLSNKVQDIIYATYKEYNAK